MPPSSPGLARTGLVALALLTAACSSSSHQGAAPHGEQTLHVKVRDFAIRAPQHIAAGAVRFDVRNGGPDTHELILVRADGGALPLRPDNLTVDEDALKPRTVATLENDHPGSERVLKARLAPGTYVLFCNMSGHYLGGMHTELIVR